MQELVRVHVGRSIMEGEIVKARLQAEGVPAMLRGEGTGPYRIGSVEVWVPADMELHARIVLEQDVAAPAEPAEPARAVEAVPAEPEKPAEAADEER